MPNNRPTWLGLPDLPDDPKGKQWAEYEAEFDGALEPFDVLLERRLQNDREHAIPDTQFSS